MHSVPSDGHFDPPAVLSLWRTGAAFAFVVTCLAALEIYVGVGAIVLVVPLLTAPRLSLKVLLGFAVFVAIKTMIGVYNDMGPEFAMYEFSWGAAAREYIALITTALMFVLGCSVMTRKFFDRMPSGALLMVPMLNIIIHALTRKDVLSATADNTQIISLYILYLVSLRLGDKLWPLLAVVMAAFIGAGLKNSFTTVAVAIIFICYVAKGFGLFDRTGPYRAMVSIYVAAFMVLSLVAYLFVFRVTSDVGEGNNGYTRSLLAHFAYRTFFDHPLTGTTFGLPAVPSDAIFTLNWTQYLTGEGGANIYGLSFHNSLLYLLTRLGGIGYVILLWLVLRLAPRRGYMLDAAFTAVPFLFLSANVVLESVRAGPGVALVLGALFSTVVTGDFRQMQVVTMADRPSSDRRDFAGEPA